MASRILVVDDDPDILDVLAEAIASDRHVVTRAHDGEDAIEKLRASEFDVVVSDVRMPGASGFDVLALIKQRSPATEVILTTAYATMPTAIECMRAGGFDFVQKPVELDELLGTVARACAYAHLRIAADALLATHDAASVPRVVVDAAVEALTADDATLLMPGSDGRLYVTYASGPAAAARTQAPVAIGEGVAGRVALEGTPVLLNGEAASDPRFAGVRSPRGVASSIVYPLRARGRLVGVLCVNRLGTKRPFRSTDLRLVAILASQAVLALENAGMASQRAILERMAAVGRAAAEVVHELSNPLSCVLASLEYVRAVMDSDAPKPPPAWVEGARGRGPIAEALDDAFEATQRVREIVADVRAMARAEAPGASRFDLGELVRSAVRLARTSMAGRPAITIDVEPELTVAGTSRAISQVLINLLHNAASALAEAGTEPPAITVTARGEGNDAMVSVEDNGPGVPAEHADRLFDAFYTTRGDRGGTGLGLAISRDIVRRHGGVLELASSSSRGAVFRFTLPRARAREGASPAAADDAPTTH